MDKSIEQLIIDIEGQGFIGAGPSKLIDNPEWKILKERVLVKAVMPKAPEVLKRKVVKATLPKGSAAAGLFVTKKAGKK